MASRPMTPEWEAEIIADLLSGMRIIDIAEKHSIGKRRVMGIRDRNHIKCRSKQSQYAKTQLMTPEWEAEIAADLRSGMKIDTIMVKHHIGYNRLAEIQCKYNLFRQSGKRAAQEEAEFWNKFPTMWDEARFRIIGRQKKKHSESWIWA